MKVFQLIGSEQDTNVPTCGIAFRRSAQVSSYRVGWAYWAGVGSTPHTRTPLRYKVTVCVSWYTKLGSEMNE